MMSVIPVLTGCHPDPCHNNERAERFIRFDVMFWIGTSLIAVTLERLSMQTARQRHEQARFAAMRPDIIFVTIPMDKDRPQLRSCLPGVCDGFWHGLRHPLGPYRPEALRRE